MKKLVVAAACAAVFMLPQQATAGGIIDIGQAFSTALAPYIDAGVQAVIAALIGWVLVIVKNKFNVQIEAQYRDTLTSFLQRQASSLIQLGAVKLNGVKINVDNDALANAANAALNAIPDAMKFFGLTPDKIAEMIKDHVPKEPSVAAAAAVALDTANPATPSTPPTIAVVAPAQK